MPSPPAGPIAAALNVMSTGEAADPVHLADVERALYVLTGWEKPAAAVASMLDVVEAYATGRRAGRSVAMLGHGSVACTRKHLDEHVCVVSERPTVDCTHGCRDAADALTRLGQELAAPLPPGDGNSPCVAPAGCVVLEGCPRGCQVARFEAAERARRTVEGITAELMPVTTRDARALDVAAGSVPVEPVAERVVPGERESERVVSSRTRYEPALTVSQLLAADPATLTVAQRGAQAALVSGEQRCSACKTVRPLSEFYRDKSRLVAHMSRCKACSNSGRKR